MSDGGVTADRLEHAARARHEAAGTRARLKTATEFAEGTTAQRRVVERAQVAEDSDVERLESMSWSRIVSSLRGSRATDLERERAERDAARYAVGVARSREDVAWREVQVIQGRLDALGDVEKAYHEALTAHEQWSVEHDPEAASALRVVGERRGVLLAEEQEVREAHVAGKAALDLLVRAGDLLGKARTLSTWDTFGGGGLLVGLAKYDRLDDAADVLRYADAALGRFSRELEDVRLSGVEAVNLTGLMKTFDLFFDNIFTDAAVRSRIREAEDRVAVTREAVESTILGLTDRHRAITAELDELWDQRERILLG